MELKAGPLTYRLHSIPVVRIRQRGRNINGTSCVVGYEQVAGPTMGLLHVEIEAWVSVEAASGNQV